MGNFVEEGQSWREVPSGQQTPVAQGRGASEAAEEALLGLGQNAGQASPAAAESGASSNLWPAVISGVTTVASGLLSKKGADAQNAAGRLASDRAENARLQSMAATSDVNMQKMATLLFPGLFADAVRDPNVMRPVVIDDRSVEQGLEGRAMGGPVEGGQPYMMGEQGPETVVEGGGGPGGPPMAPPGDPGMAPPPGDPAMAGAPPAGGDPLAGIPPELVQAIMAVLMQILGGGAQGGPGGAPGGAPMDPAAMGAPPAMAGGDPAAMMGGAPPMGAPPMMDPMAGGGMPGGMPEPRAQGGPVTPGKSYLVGEQGPEIVTPQQPGVVIPNPATPMPQATPGGTPVPGQGQGPPAPPVGGLLPNPESGATAPGDRPPATGTPPGPPPAPGTDNGGRDLDPYRNAVVGSPIPVPVPGGAPRPDFEYPGQAATYQTHQLLNNPGQLSPAAYERAQEQANIIQQQGMNGLLGMSGASGVSPFSGAAGALSNAHSLGAANMRNDAAREYTMAQEALKRQDVQQGFGQYVTMLQALMQRQQMQGAAAAGTGFPSASAVDPWGGINNGLQTLMQGLQDRWANQSQSTYPPQQTQYDSTGQYPESTQTTGEIFG